MSDFQRKLNRIDSLQGLASANGANWWKELLQEWRLSGEDAGTDGLRLAIRDNYLNFYHRGQSVARVAFDANGAPYASVHLKYLGEPQVIKGKEYARLIDGFFCASGRADIPFTTGKTLSSIIHASEKWTGREKFMVDLIVAQTPSVVDLEIGLPRIGEKGGAPRMDLAALEEDRVSKGVKLVFWEAKTIDDSRLRATVPEEAEVHKQLGKYVLFMKDDDRRSNATNQYRHCCELLVQLAKMAGKEAALSPLVRRVADGDAFDLDPNPRLIIFEGKTKKGLEEWEVRQGREWEVYERVITATWPTKFSATDGYRVA
jgi:hypothetical protein